MANKKVNQKKIMEKINKLSGVNEKVQNERQKSFEKARNARIDIQHCDACGKDKKSSEFYLSVNPAHKNGVLPYCKECIKFMSIDVKGNLDKQKTIKMLKTVDKPYIEELWRKALVSSSRNPIGIYFTGLNFAKYKLYTWEDGDLDKLDAPDEIVENEPTEEEKIENFAVTNEMIQLFGTGFTDEEYRRMNEKYNFLSASYNDPTNMHKEALLSYIRLKVKEEIAISQNKASDAKTWGELAMKQADKAKINPSQLSKADLTGGIDTFGNLTKAIEERVDIIKQLPQFKFRPNDAVDFCIWCYINYARDLEGKPLVEYEDVYKFYDEMKETWIRDMGDPYGIFKDDVTLGNRDKIKDFIKIDDEKDDDNG